MVNSFIIKKRTHAHTQYLIPTYARNDYINLLFMKSKLEPCKWLKR